MHPSEDEVSYWESQSYAEPRWDLSSGWANWALALHLAVEVGDLAALRRGLAAGADVHASDQQGDTPLHRAARLGNVSAVRILVEAGANVETQARNSFNGFTQLHCAAYHGHVPAMLALLQAGAPVDAAASTGWGTALLVAAEKGHAAAVTALCAAGANVNARNESSGSTPLHAAAAGGGEAAVRALIAAGAEVDAVDAYRRETALHCAVNRNQAGAVTALLAAGATARAVDSDGRTPQALVLGLLAHHYSIYAATFAALVAGGACDWAAVLAPSRGLDHALLAVWRASPEALEQLGPRLEPGPRAWAQAALRCLHRTPLPSQLYPLVLGCVFA